MTIRDDRTAFDSTSAGWMQQVREPVLLGCMLAGLGTSSARALPLEIPPGVPRATEQTSSGTSLAEVEPAGVAIAELRRRSGLTWDQLARLFNVSRRALHFWASGKPMTPSNEEHLQRVLSALRKIDRGSASANRSILLRVERTAAWPSTCSQLGTTTGSSRCSGRKNSVCVHQDSHGKCALREHHDPGKNSSKLDKIEYTPREVVCLPRKRCARLDRSEYVMLAQGDGTVEQIDAALESWRQGEQVGRVRVPGTKTELAEAVGGDTPWPLRSRATTGRLRARGRRRQCAARDAQHLAPT